MDPSNLSNLTKYANEVTSALSSVSDNDIEEVIECIISASIKTKKIWIIGNGGSSATASHFAADLMRRNNQEIFRIRASSLSESSSRLTAIGNDFAFEDIFEVQIQDLAGEGDILIALSASGNSPNLIKGVLRAKEMKLKVISMVGFDGGKLKNQSDISLHYVTDIGSYEIAEDAHSLTCHYIANRVRGKLEEIALLPKGL